jgi:hypothetical protein
VLGIIEAVLSIIGVLLGLSQVWLRSSRVELGDIEAGLDIRWGGV